MLFNNVIARSPKGDVAIFLFLLLLSCNSPSETTLQIINSDGTRTPDIYVEIADTDSERQMGLMYRKEMAENKGMFFIFPKEEIRSFWMKNTYLELDIIFINKQLEVVSIIHKAKPLSERSLKSLKPALYVLEILGGQAKAWNIQKGSKLSVKDLNLAS